LLNARLF